MPVVAVAAPAPGPYHDPDHARGELPSADARRGELKFLRGALDSMYAHREAKLSRHGLNEDDVFADTERLLVAATTWAAYDAAIYDMLARFHDGHLTYKPPATAAPKRGYTSFSLGLGTVLASGHLLIDRVDPGSSVAAAGASPGDDVIAIDGRAVADLLAEAGASRAVSRPESAMTTFARTWTTVLYPKASAPRARTIKVAKRLGGELEIAIAPAKLDKQHHEPFAVAMQGDVAVVTIGSLDGGSARAKQLDDALARARAAKAIAIDLRGNRGGVDVVGHRVLADLAGGTASLGSYRVLVSQTTLDLRPQWKQLVAQADGFSPPQPITVQALDHGFPGKVAVIVDAACASTCEVIAAALRADVGAVIVGETTGGSSGAPVSINLPQSRSTVAIPTWSLLSAEGKPIEDFGVVPDVVVEATPDALARGGDLPLETAISKLRP
ncbi:MAG TPA: S41 family peptidase [Kofleriaceae bacterium]|nr:S41 family peptidase [Kofleriaceae bacterium]